MLLIIKQNSFFMSLVPGRDMGAWRGIGLSPPSSIIILTEDNKISGIIKTDYLSYHYTLE